VAGLERALPASWYLSPEAFALERERVLYREWFCAGRVDQVQRPGSLVVLDVAGESVLLVRTRDGELRPLQRLPPPRLQVVPALPARPRASPPAARKAGSLRCPNHSWTYRLDGDLLRAPWTEDVDGFDPAAFGLHPVGVACTPCPPTATSCSARCPATIGSWSPSAPPTPSSSRRCSAGSWPSSPSTAAPRRSCARSTRAVPP
jgi:hypothetical protein